MRIPIAAMLLAALVGMNACAPSELVVKKARTARYDTDREKVWLGVIASLRQVYPRIRILSIDDQRLVTNWIMVNRDVEEMEGHIVNPNAIFMRVTVAVSPTAPYKIGLDVQAAQYRPNLTDLVPFPHGSEDEPQWVEGRANRLYTTIFDVLHQFAVATPPPTPQSTPLPAASDGATDATLQAATELR
jgi:hypothetical protein